VAGANIEDILPGCQTRIEDFGDMRMTQASIPGKDVHQRRRVTCKVASPDNLHDHFIPAQPLVRRNER
jgi:hypothetical protein